MAREPKSRLVPADGPSTSRLRIALRLTVGLAILGYLVWRASPSTIGAALLSVSPLWIVGALAIQIFGKFIWALRWSSLLRVFGSSIPLGRLVRGLYVGLFFNNVLPTVVGGDLFRAHWVLAGESDYQQSLLTVFLERVIGVISLGYVALPGFLLLALQRGDWNNPLLIAVGGVLAVVCGSVILLNPGIYKRLEGWLFPDGRKWFVGLRRRIGDSLGALHSSGGRMWEIYALSAGVQLVGIAFFYCLGQAIGLRLSGRHYVVIVPLVSLVTMIPITINGIGLREGAWIVIPGLLGLAVATEHAVAIGLLSTLLVLAVSLAGGVFYIKGGYSAHVD